VTSHDYKKLGAWYNEFLGFKQTTDNGRDVYQWFGDSVWIPTATRQGGKSSAELNTRGIEAPQDDCCGFGCGRQPGYQLRGHQQLQNPGVRLESGDQCGS
jgi:hypothetical protein